MYWYERRWFHAALVLVSLIPLFYPTIPPLVDLPGHMGRYKVELNYDSVSVLRQFYSFHWQLIGNLGVDLLIIPMAKLFGLELGTKLIVMGIIALTVTGLLWIGREVHGNVPPTALFALPLAYGHPFMFGFVNYCLAMGLALCAFALWLRLERLGQYRTRTIVFLLLSPLLWVCHIYGWAALCLLCGSAELIHQHDKTGSWLKAFWRAALQCFSLAPPLVLMVLWREGGHVSGKTGDWFDWSRKFQWVYMILRDRWILADWASLALLGLLVGWVALVATIPLVCNRFSIALPRFFKQPRLTFSRNLALSALILVVAFTAIPRVVFGSAYADMRLTPYIVAIALIGIRMRPNVGPRLQASLAIAGLLFFAGRTAGTTISFYRSAQVYSHALGGLDHVPAGARLVSFVGHSCRTAWITNRLEHVPAMAIVRRDAFSNDQWDMEGAQLMTSIYPHGPGYALHYRGDPSELVTYAPCKGEFWKTIDYALAHVPRHDFDYVWLLDPPPFDPKNVRGMMQIWHDGKNRLYRIEVRDLTEAQAGTR